MPLPLRLLSPSLARARARTSPSAPRSLRTTPAGCSVPPSSPPHIQAKQAQAEQAGGDSAAPAAKVGSKERARLALLKHNEASQGLGQDSIDRPALSIDATTAEQVGLSGKESSAETAVRARTRARARRPSFFLRRWLAHAARRRPIR